MEQASPQTLNSDKHERLCRLVMLIRELGFVRESGEDEEQTSHAKT
jgi:hypothetical protein